MSRNFSKNKYIFKKIIKAKLKATLRHIDTNSVQIFKDTLWSNIKHFIYLYILFEIKFERTIEMMTK